MIRDGFLHAEATWWAWRTARKQVCASKVGGFSVSDCGEEKELRRDG